MCRLLALVRVTIPSLVDVAAVHVWVHVVLTRRQANSLYVVGAADRMYEFVSMAGH